MPGPMRNATKMQSRAHRAAGLRPGLIALPAEGCDLPVPAIPKGRQWSKDERKMWRELWQSPQATQWDESFTAAVAAYVTHASAIYAGAASAWQAQEFRHLGAQLGLTPGGLQSLGWVVIGSEDQ